MTDVARAVAAAYNEAADRFAESAEPLVYRTVATPLAKALSRAAGTRAGLVLDVAAGSGALGRSFPQVVAVDVAARQLTANRSRCRVVGDGERLPFRDDAFAAAASAFGINHFGHPARAVQEMARVAPVVAVSTWVRPEREHRPKQAVHLALERQVGRTRTPLGELLDRMSDRVGTAEAVTSLLAAAGLDPWVRTVEVEVPWPGLDRYVDYRLSMPTTPAAVDHIAVREDVRRALEDAAPEELTWRPLIVVGVGTRCPGRSAARQLLGKRPAGDEPGAEFLR